MRFVGSAWILSMLSVMGIVDSARILVLVPFSGKSHYLSMKPLIQELSARGHDLTVMSTYKEEDAEYEQIIVKKRMFWEALDDPSAIHELESWSMPRMLKTVWDSCHSIVDVALSTDAVRDFIANDTSTFDLILYENFAMEALLMFSHKYGAAPVVAFSTFGHSLYLGSAVGNPVLASYMGHEMSGGTPVGFWGRVANMYYVWYDFYWREHYALPRQQALAEKHFGSLPGGPLPSLADLHRNIALVLVNSHFSYDDAMPCVPGVVEVGGLHVKKTKPLPEDIQKFLDDAEDGAVFFSLGSNIQTKDLPEHKVQMILNVFRRLKSRVLWKWEDDHLPNQPKNLMISKWMPQNDILGHKNVKLFVTHGGLLSTQEAMHHGVPVIGLPFYGDQHRNMERIERSGFGLRLAFSSLEERAFEEAVARVLGDATFAKKAAEVSARFRDRPLSAMDTAVYWIEYVIKHRESTGHMRSMAIDMSTLVHYSLDLILAALAVSFACAYFIFKCALSFLRDDSKRASEDYNKKKR